MESAYTLNINSPEKTKKIKKVIKSILIYIAFPSGFTLCFSSTFISFKKFFLDTGNHQYWRRGIPEDILSRHLSRRFAEYGIYQRLKKYAHCSCM